MPASPTVSARPLPPGQVLLPSAAIGSLSIVLAVGLQSLGILSHLNAAVARILSGDHDLPKSLPAWLVWLAAVILAFGISFAILSVPGTWRRVVLWVTAMVLAGGWAPVLVLAAREPEIGAVIVAATWSGVCALVYASRHRMACDDFSNFPTDETR
ncbi:MAG: hypothetical protein ABIT37_14265 [Luteolibacter sp.]